MKRTGLLLAGMITLMLTGCGNDTKQIGGTEPVQNETQTVDNQDNSGEDTTGTPSFVASGYYLTIDGYKLAIDDYMDNVKSAMGTEESYFEAPSCAFDGIEKTYTYKNGEVEVRTYIDSDGTDRVNFIVLKNDLISTDEGLSIGDNVDKVKECYGEDYKDNNGSFEYSKDNMKLLIVIEEDSVVSIQYMSTAVNN